MFSLRKTMLASIALVAVSFGAATVAHADPIISPVGTSNNASFITASQYNLVQFTLGSSLTNVSVAAGLVTTTAGRTGTAFLTTQVGPGTTPANQLASTAFNFAVVPTLSTPTSLVNLFSGLTLGPGTYFVVFSSANTVNDTGISVGTGVTYATAPGASVGNEQFSAGANINPAYPPASTFVNATTGNRVFRVDGTQQVTAPIPEPTTMLLLGTGIAGAALKARRRRRKAGCHSEEAQL